MHFVDTQIRFVYFNTHPFLEDIIKIIHTIKLKDITFGIMIVYDSWVKKIKYTQKGDILTINLKINQ